MTDKDFFRIALIAGALVITVVPMACSLASAGERSLVIEIVACEASGEGVEGIKAVSSVIKRRMIDRNQTAEQVVTAKKQFSCYANGGVVRKITDSEYKTALLAWETAEAGEYNHYFAHGIVKPYWAKNYKKKMVLGNHTFLEL